VRIVAPAGTVLAVATIWGLIKHGNRLEVLGDLLEGDPRVGSQIGLSKSQNPISYHLTYRKKVTWEGQSRVTGPYPPFIPGSHTQGLPSLCVMFARLAR
jgi:hypothetical protein